MEDLKPEILNLAPKLGDFLVQELIKEIQNIDQSVGEIYFNPK